MLCNALDNRIDGTGFSKDDKIFASIKGVLDPHTKLVCDDPDYISLDNPPCTPYQPFSWNKIYDGLDCSRPFSAYFSFKLTADRDPSFTILSLIWLTNIYTIKGSDGGKRSS